MYLVMDTESYAVKSELKASFTKPILTVWTFLEDKGLEHLLEDPLWITASASISRDSGEMSKRQIAIMCDKKQQAVESILSLYSSGNVDLYCGIRKTDMLIAC